MTGDATGKYTFQKYQIYWFYHSQGMTGLRLTESLPVAADPVPFEGIPSAQ